MPAIVENCFSSGVATAAAIVSGLAPGRLALTVIVGIVDGRQVAHRQLPVGDDAEDEDADHDQRRHDRPADEQLGEVHVAPARALSPEALICTFEPDRSRSCPSVTTRSPGLDTAADDGEAVRDALHLDREGLGGAVRLDDEHETALLARRPRPAAGTTSALVSA